MSVCGFMPGCFPSSPTFAPMRPILATPSENNQEQNLRAANSRGISRLSACFGLGVSSILVRMIHTFPCFYAYLCDAFGKQSIAKSTSSQFSGNTVSWLSTSMDLSVGRLYDSCPDVSHPPLLLRLSSGCFSGDNQ